MSVVVGLRQAMAAQLKEHAPPKVQVRPINPAEETKVSGGALWIEDVNVSSEWRGLGANAAASHERRTESGQVSIIALCYRESGRQTTAADHALAKVDSIIAGVEAAVEADPSFGGRFAMCRVNEIAYPLGSKPNGWTAMAQIVLDIKTYP